MDRVIEWVKKCAYNCSVVYAPNQDSNQIKSNFKKLEEEYSSFSGEEKCKVHRIISTQFGRDLIFLLSTIVRNMSLKDFDKLLIDELMSYNTNCYYSAMLELQVVRKIDGLYQEKRLLHRKNTNVYRNTLLPNYLYQSKEGRNKKRIAIFVEQLLSELHAPTKVLLDLLYVLQNEMEFEIKLFVCPSDVQLPDDIWPMAEVMNYNVDAKNKAFEFQYEDEVFGGYQINMGETSHVGYSMMLDLIYNWNPMFVLNLGGVNPIADLINDFTTLVYMPVTAGLGVSDADILIRLDKSEKYDEQEKSVSKHQKVLQIEESVPTVFKKTDNLVRREDLGLPQDKFLIAIVGNRLDMEVDRKFMEMLCSIVDKCENIAFVVIGTVNEMKSLVMEYNLSEKVYYLGYRKDLMSVYECMDLYLNPFRKGGGYSASMAMATNLPVITLPDGDVGENVGQDFVVSNIDSIVDTTIKYVRDKEFYQKMKNNTNKRVATKEQAIDNRKHMVNQIIELIYKEA